MDEQEIRDAVKIHYAGYVEYMQGLEAPSIEDICQWEIYKEQKHQKDIEIEVHGCFYPEEL